MREGIAGTYQYAMMITFIAIFIAFLAFSINYAQAFKVKNKLINIVEQYGGLTADAEDEIEKYISDIGYHPWGGGSVIIRDEIRDMISCNTIGTPIPGYGSYQVCEVTAVMSLNLPIGGQSLSFDVPITGSSKLIYIHN